MTSCFSISTSKSCFDSSMLRCPRCHSDRDLLSQDEHPNPNPVPIPTCNTLPGARCPKVTFVGSLIDHAAHLELPILPRRVALGFVLVFVARARAD
jgi:hypothetical protein